MLIWLLHECNSIRSMYTWKQVAVYYCNELADIIFACTFLLLTQWVCR